MYRHRSPCFLRVVPVIVHVSAYIYIWAAGPIGDVQSPITFLQITSPQSTEGLNMSGNDSASLLLNPLAPCHNPDRFVHLLQTVCVAGWPHARRATRDSPLSPGVVARLEETTNRGGSREEDFLGSVFCVSLFPYLFCLGCDEFVWHPDARVCWPMGWILFFFTCHGLMGAIHRRREQDPRSQDNWRVKRAERNGIHLPKPLLQGSYFHHHKPLYKLI
jgi:hypothetical protein